MKHICSALKRNSDQNGFTLVELIVVIAILAILSAVAYPVYNGYIAYAHKGVDKDTVGEIMHAINIAYQSDALVNTYEPEGGVPVQIGRVYMQYAEDGSTEVSVEDMLAFSDDGEVYPFVDGAISDAFGDDYASTLSLQYDKWEGRDESAGGDAASGWTNKDAQGLMDDVSDCSDALAKYLSTDTFDLMYGFLNGGNVMTARALKTGAGKDMLEQAGYTGALDDVKKLSKEEAARILGNVTVFGAAQYAQANNDTIVNMFKGDGDYANAAALKNVGLGLAQKNNFLYEFANTYGALDALVSYLDDDSVQSEFDKILIVEGAEKASSASNCTSVILQMGKVQDAIKAKINSSPELKAKAEAYYKSVDGQPSQAELDGKSYVDILTKVYNVQAKYNTKENLSSDVLFRTTVGPELSSILGEVKGIAVNVYSDGTFQVVPEEADPTK